MSTPEMPADTVLELLTVFAAAGIAVWLDGGWAVDAALEQQTRSHKDLDLILQVSDLPAFTALLTDRGFALQAGGSACNFILADAVGHEVDVHAVVFSPAGDGVYRMGNGEDWIFPARGFEGHGKIQGVSVRCLTPEVQVACHAQGYVPTAKDLQDMAFLQARFGVTLPRHLQQPQALEEAF